MATRIQSEDPDDDLAAQAQPLAGRDPLAVDLADITLPPADLVDELDNQRPAADVAPREEAEVATLEFCGDEKPYATVPLKYPFRWEGVRHDEITVRQLSTAEVGRILRDVSLQGKQPELFDFYAAMCGLPAKVLRALPASDGDEVTNKGWDFLPPSLRPASD